MRKLAVTARAFLKSRRANVAVMFALALVPLMIGAGAGLDYARAMLVRQQMGEALDAAALAVGSTSGLTQATAQTLAQKYFDANYTVDKTDYGSPTISIPSSGYDSKGSVTITATSTMPTVLMKLVGITSLPISTSSNVVWGQTKLWVALVLDNSGSMSQGDSTGSKMTALKNGSNQLLTILQNAAAHPGDVQVSIVPFVKNVNVGTANVGASWIDWADWDSPPIVDQTNYVYQKDTDAVLNGQQLKTFGPGDSCPYDGTAGYKCALTPANATNCTGSGGSGCTGTVPSSGTYNGYICPSMHSGGTQDGLGYHFYNGCWVGTTSTTTATIATGSSATCSGHSNSNCSCTGSNSSKTCTTKVWNHTWVPNAHSTWTGCLMDRKQSYDITNTTPGPANTLFPAENNQYCGTATITPLGYDWTTLTSQINAMTAYGATDQAIGIAHGWQTISQGSPYGAPAVPDDTTRYIIFFSDGLNTMNRWWGDGSTENTTADGYIDAREKATCDAAKADGIVIYSIYVNVGNSGGSGNSAPLQYCASDPTKYFALTTTSGVVTTFNQIAQQITNVRVVK
ncbi:MAG TPA: TadE/TadG family type IV pilus assembly protein [Rhizomicrobium sp.]|nr:TadE/TadG family type IV pilus assembly protein [Rhizomicrobium sp.]